jgi:uncharacterized protein DUF3644
MKSRARCLLDKSREAMLAAIEVYNKPAFSYREEAFSVLAVNAWELLLKARVLQIDGNRIAAILEYDRQAAPGARRFRKKNRSGNCVTVGLFKAHDLLLSKYHDKIDASIRKNLEALVEVRDNAVHFFNKNMEVERAIHEIGAASVKNYVAAARQWFGMDLTRFRVFLMPLAFLSAPTICEGVNLNAEERHLMNFLKTIREDKSAAGTGDFDVALAVEVRVRRTKDSGAMPFTISDAPNAVPVRLDEEDIRDRYPWSYDMLTERLKKRYANFKANNTYHGYRRPLETDARYCRERLLDPGNPKGLRKKFYSPEIVKVFDPHYQRAPVTSVGAG